MDFALSAKAEDDCARAWDFMREHVFPELNNLRTAVDKLETIVSDELWPLPTYREMLFIK